MDTSESRNVEGSCAENRVRLLVEGHDEQVVNVVENRGKLMRLQIDGRYTNVEGGGMRGSVHISHITYIMRVIVGKSTNTV